MHLWLLKRDDHSVEYDENAGFVIRAETEESARRVASENGGDETKPRVLGPDSGKPTTNPWLDANLSSCQQLMEDGDEGVMLADFNAG